MHGCLGWSFDHFELEQITSDHSADHFDVNPSSGRIFSDLGLAKAVVAILRLEAGAKPALAYHLIRGIGFASLTMSLYYVILIWGKMTLSLNKLCKSPIRRARVF